MTYKPTGLFNSHPHKEDDPEQKVFVVFASFSTHILTRRMTSELLFIQSNYAFSTHILTRRMTMCEFYCHT